MNIYFRHFGLQTGFTAGHDPNNERHFSRASGWELYVHLQAQAQKLYCFRCGMLATFWLVMRHKNDHQNQPVMNLFGHKTGGVITMMTRDHIIPKSLGGVDAVQNLRCACERCNTNRGNELNQEDLAFLKAHPELIDPERLVKGLASLQSKVVSVQNKPDQSAKWKAAKIKALQQPYKMAGFL